jgi:hypothetical protein
VTDQHLDARRSLKVAIDMKDLERIPPAPSTQAVISRDGLPDMAHVGPSACGQHDKWPQGRRLYRLSTQADPISELYPH